MFYVNSCDGDKEVLSVVFVYNKFGVYWCLEIIQENFFFGDVNNSV